MALFQLRVVFPLVTKIFIYSLIVIWFSSSCKKDNKSESSLPFYNTADFTAKWINNNADDYQKIHTIEHFSFYDQNGNIFNSDSLKGKIYVANFFFTICPSICPKMTSNLGTLQSTFSQEKAFKIVSFSVTPWIDSVAKLKKYSLKHNINAANWRLLTGEKEQIYTLGRKSFFAEKTLGLTKNKTDFLHTETMVLIDKKSRIRGVYSATNPDEIPRITEDIRTLLKE
ncbi:MAG: SCO family protein [Bacteroidota bacterium]